MATHHLVGRLKARVRHLRNRVLLVVGLVGTNDRCVRSEGEVDPREGDEVGLELVQVDVEGTVESKRGGDRGDDLSDQPVEVGVGGRLDAEVSSADLVDAKQSEEGMYQSRLGLEFKGGRRTPRCQP